MKKLLHAILIALFLIVFIQTGNMVFGQVTYCEPVGDPHSTSHIQNFLAYAENGTDSINNSSLNGLTNSGGYSDYSSIYLTATAGSTINFMATYISEWSTVEMDLDDAGIAIWVDWNIDGDFDDENERVYATENNQFPESPHGGSFTVGQNIKAGRYRMRVCCDFFVSPPTNPCKGSNSQLLIGGEYEDYSIVVSADCSTPAISASANPTTICAGQTANISASATSTDSDVTFTYEWNQNITNGKNFDVNPTETTTYTVTVTTSNGCSNSASVSVAVNPLPIATISPENISMCAGGTITLTATGGTTFLWSGSANGSSNQISVSNAGTYIVQATDENGCSATASKTISTAEVTTPHATELENIDYLWTGKTSADWNEISNWAKYDGTNFTTSGLPSGNDNVLISQYGECVNQFPIINGDQYVNNILIDSSASVSGGDDTADSLHIKGNLTNNGEFICQYGKIIFDGDTVQTISGNPIIFNDFKIDNTKGVTITAEPTINGIASFIKGIVKGNLTFGENATSTGSGSLSFVAGVVTKKYGTSSTDFIFPTGNLDENIYAPFKASANQQVSVEYKRGHDGMPDWWEHNGNMGTSDTKINHASNVEHWVVKATAGTQLDNVSLYWFGSNNEHNFEEISNLSDSAFVAYMQEHLRIAYADYHTGLAEWSSMGNENTIMGNEDIGFIHNSGTVNISASRANNDISKVFTFGYKASIDDPIPIDMQLPIELTDFHGECIDEYSANIYWTTATETNNDYFVLEKSENAISFAEISQIKGSGKSIEKIDYLCLDNNLYTGNNYYRLRQVGYDKTEIESKIIVVNCKSHKTDKTPKLSAYPNPFTNELNIKIENLTECFCIEIFDTKGRLVYTKNYTHKVSTNDLLLNLNHLPSDIYTIRISSPSQILKTKVVKE